MNRKTFQYASIEDKSSSSSDRDDDVPIELPGFGYSVTKMPYQVYNSDAKKRKIRRRMRFPTALGEDDPNEEEITPFVFREVLMLRIMNELTDKPEWSRKVFDENITKKWRDEALSAQPDNVTDECINYVSQH